MLKNKQLLTVAVIGFSISFLSYFIANFLEQKRMQTIFDNSAINHLNTIKESIRSAEFITESVHNLFSSSKTVSADEFNRFTSSYSNIPVGIKSIKWAPKVTLSELSTNNKSVFTNIPGKEKTALDSVINDFYPVQYVQIFNDELTTVNGSNIGSKIDFEKFYNGQQPGLENLNNFIPNRMITVIKDHEFHLIKPYEEKKDPAESNSVNLLGFISTELSQKILLGGNLDKAEHEILDLIVYNSSDQTAKSFVYSNNKEYHDESFSSVQSSAVMKFHKIINLGDEEFSILYTPTKKFIYANSAIIPEMLFAICFTLTILTLIYLYYVNKRDSVMNNLLSENSSKLKESNERLDLALEGASLGIWDWDIESNEVYFSDKWVEMIGYRPNEIEPNLSSWFNILHPEDKNEVYSLLNSHLENNASSFSIEYRIQTQSGQWKWVQSSGKVVERNKDGSAKRATGIHMDIDQRKHSQQQIVEYNQKLEKANFDKNKLFSIIGHDLKSPLISIKGFSEFLVREFDDIDRNEIQQYSKYIYDASSTLQNMLQSLLEWGRLQMGRSHFAPINYDIRDQIEKVVSQNVLVSLNKRVEIINNANHNISVFADEAMIETALRNLVSNAIKFTPSNGKILIDAKELDDHVVVSVADSGIGIEPEKLNNMFKESFHKSTQGTDGEKGTGLGLSLCKEFIEKNCGIIWAESKINKGTTFYFSLYSNEKDVKKELQSVAT